MQKKCSAQDGPARAPDVTLSRRRGSALLAAAGPSIMALRSERRQCPDATSRCLALLWAGVMVTAAASNCTDVLLQNPMQLFDTAGARMNVHDGDVRQWTPGGPYYYYGMCASTAVHIRHTYKRCSAARCRSSMRMTVGVRHQPHDLQRSHAPTEPSRRLRAR